MKILLKDYVILPLVLIAVLFDTNGSAYGQLLIDNVVLTFVGGFIGNLLWVGGCFLMFMGICMIILAIQLPDEDKLSLLAACTHRWPVVDYVVGIIAVGTVILLFEGGFWFTGTTCIVYGIGRHILLGACKEIKKEAETTNA